MSVKLIFIISETTVFIEYVLFISRNRLGSILMTLFIYLYTDWDTIRYNEHVLF